MNDDFEYLDDNESNDGEEACNYDGSDGEVNLNPDH